MKEHDATVTIGPLYAWKLISKESELSGAWEKTTEALEIEGSGCLVRSIIKLVSEITQSMEFIPGVKLREYKDASGADVCQLITI